MTPKAHTKAECHKGWDGGPCGECMVCELYLCSVCGGFEGSLPTDCPGERMSPQTEDDIYAGHLDYREGKGWCLPDGTGTSMGDTMIKYPNAFRKVEEQDE